MLEKPDPPRQSGLVDPSIDNNYAIRTASEKGYLEIVELLLQDPRVDPCVNNNYPIRIASKMGHLETIGLLHRSPREARINYTVEDINRPVPTSENKYFGIIKLLLQDSRVDPSVDNNYLVRMASQNGLLDIIKVLFQGSRVGNCHKEMDPLDQSPINSANDCEKERISNLLHRLPAHKCDKYGYQVEPQCFKIIPDDNLHEGMINLLPLNQDSCGEIMASFPKSFSPNKNQPFKLVDPSACNNYPIRMASQNGHIEVVELLLKDPRVDPGADNNYAIRIAHQNGHSKIVKLLLGDNISEICG